jgi:elongation factor P
MADTSDIRNGLIMNMDGQYWAVQEFLHVKPGKGGAFIRTKIKNLLTGQVKDRPSGRARDRRGAGRPPAVPVPLPVRRRLSHDGPDVVRADELSGSMVDDARYYLKENMELSILMDGDKPLTMGCPTSST